MKNLTWEIFWISLYNNFQFYFIKKNLYLARFESEPSYNYYKNFQYKYLLISIQNQKVYKIQFTILHQYLSTSTLYIYFCCLFAISILLLFCNLLICSKIILYYKNKKTRKKIIYYTIIKIKLCLFYSLNPYLSISFQPSYDFVFLSIIIQLSSLHHVIVLIKTEWIWFDLIWMSWYLFVVMI